MCSAPCFLSAVNCHSVCVCSCAPCSLDLIKSIVYGAPRLLRAPCSQRIVTEQPEPARRRPRLRGSGLRGNQSRRSRGNQVRRRPRLSQARHHSQLIPARRKLVWQARRRFMWQACLSRLPPSQSPLLDSALQSPLLDSALQCQPLKSAMLCLRLQSALQCRPLENAMQCPPLQGPFLKCPTLQGPFLKCPCFQSAPMCVRFQSAPKCPIEPLLSPRTFFGGSRAPAREAGVGAGAAASEAVPPGPP